MNGLIEGLKAMIVGLSNKVSQTSNFYFLESKQLEEWNNQNFWSGNMQLLKKFLQKNQIKIQQDNDSISSDCDGEEYNNTDCI